MTRERWAFETSKELDAQIEDLEEVLAHQVRKDIEKVATRGIQNVSEPLVGHLEGDIYYVRSMVKGCGWFRTFYFRDGRVSFFGFFGFFKKSDRVPKRVLKVVLEKAEEYKQRRRG